MPGKMGTIEEVHSSWGREDERRARAGLAPLHDRDSDPFWYFLGVNQERQGDPEIPWGNVIDTARDFDRQGWYLDGWNRGMALLEGKQPPFVTPGNAPDYGSWVNAGFNDARSGLYRWPRYVYTNLPPAPARPPGSGAPVIVAPPTFPSSPPPVFRGGYPPPARMRRRRRAGIIIRGDWGEVNLSQLAEQMGRRPEYRPSDLFDPYY